MTVYICIYIHIHGSTIQGRTIDDVLPELVQLEVVSMTPTSSSASSKQFIGHIQHPLGNVQVLETTIWIEDGRRCFPRET